MMNLVVCAGRVAPVGHHEVAKYIGAKPMDEREYWDSAARGSISH